MYEAAWGVQLDPRNFYRKVQSAHGFIVATGSMRRPEIGRPARLFQADPAQALYPPMTRSAQSGQAVRWLSLRPKGARRMNERPHRDARAAEAAAYLGWGEHAVLEEMDGHSIRPGRFGRNARA
uniref:NrtR DNA-binding winged helix domain-containing protein n=1 Tax=Actinomadura fulva subsp. indica TaxID=1752060 RepID=A0A1B4Z9C3_9ACTN|nr:hypothetical protein [Actinomadura fulva subsp. indica]